MYCYRIRNGCYTIAIAPQRSCGLKLDFPITRRLCQVAIHDRDRFRATDVAHGSGHARQQRSRPAIRRPRVPAGQRLVREGEWPTTDHLEACWYRLVYFSLEGRDAAKGCSFATYSVQIDAMIMLCS